MKKIPEASVNRAKKTITYKGITTYSNIFATVTVSDKKYIPSKKGIINCKPKNAWERIPTHIQERHEEWMIDKLTTGFGMNPNYNDLGTKYD